MTTVGIIGVGYLGECLVEGLAGQGHMLVLSPRNEDRVQRLSGKYGLKVASSNEDVVAEADIVILATRPVDIVETAKGLPWRAEQKVVSIAAGIGLSSIASVVSPAQAFRAMPIASCRLRQSPTAFCPPDATVEALFDGLGSSHALENEQQFNTASIFGAYYALAYAFIGEAAMWAEKNGLEAATARELAARMVQSSAAAVVDQKQRSPLELLEDLMTPGGITEEGLKVLEDTSAVTAWSKALDASYARAGQINRGE